jgi:outer membrane lipoprotein
MPKILILLLALAGLSACATGPRYPTTGVASDLVPAEVSTHPGAHREARVIWGGIIVATRNLSQYTEIEVLGYPLDSRQRPLTNRSPQGRFLVHRPGYLEEVDYGAGRRVTVTGTLGDNLTGRVGEAAYTYPLVEARDIHLWPTETQSDSGRTRFNVGVGVIFSR